MAEVLTDKRRQILDFIISFQRDHGYPPSVREIGRYVGLASSATVHDHIDRLAEGGFLVKDPTKPRALQVRYEPASGSPLTAERVRNVPLVGEVAAGTGVIAEQHLEEVLPLPERFAGTDQSFMLRVRGDSMIEAGILDGDFVVVRQQQDADVGDIVVAGIPGEEATVKRLGVEGHPGRARGSQRVLRRPRLRARRRRDLRQGPLGPPPPLSPARRPRVRQGCREHVAAADQLCDRRRARSAWWARSGSPAPKFAAGTPSDAKNDTSV